MTFRRWPTAEYRVLPGSPAAARHSPLLAPCCANPGNAQMKTAAIRPYRTYRSERAITFSSTTCNSQKKFADFISHPGDLNDVRRTETRFQSSVSGGAGVLRQSSSLLKAVARG